MKNVIQLDHPLLNHFLTQMRDKNTTSTLFRESMKRLGILLAYEATRDLKLTPHAVETPLEKLKDAPLIAEKPVLISIMRAGNGMMEAMLEILPFAHAGHVGIYRDKFIQSTVEYFFKIPKDANDRPLLLIDPLLATGDTASAALTRLKEYGASNIRFICILAAPEGIKKIQNDHPDVKIYCVSIERGLNEDGFILPGIGDAGDRLYGSVPH